MDDYDGPTEIEALLALIDQQRSEFRQSPGPRSKFYTEKPSEFSTRIDGYWKVWRSEVKVDPVAAG